MQQAIRYFVTAESIDHHKLPLLLTDLSSLAGIDKIKLT